MLPILGNRGATPLTLTHIITHDLTFDFAGELGVPYGGFPEPFRSNVLKNLPRIEVFVHSSLYS